MEPLPPELPNETIGVVVVDHGSRRTESNHMLLDVVRQFEAASPYAIVEPAHMEQAEPSIATALNRCADRGATLVVVFPYFLLPGRHWDQDIPALVVQAAERHPGLQTLVTAPLGLHPLMTEIMNQRIASCLHRASDDGPPCDICETTDPCQIRCDESEGPDTACQAGQGGGR